MLLRLNEGESVTVASRTSEDIITIIQQGDKLGFRKFMKPKDNDFDNIEEI